MHLWEIQIIGSYIMQFQVMNMHFWDSLIGMVAPYNEPKYV